MSHKSLEYDTNQHIFEFSASRSKEKMLEYKYIGIDQDDGPLYCSSTQTFNVDGKYRNYKAKYQDDSTYSIPIDKILAEHVPEIHECILYNKENWSSKFNSWFSDNSIIIAPRLDQIGYIIYENCKYIDVLWIAPVNRLLAYEGYEKNVAVVGGKEIDQCAIFDDAMNFNYVKNKMWYIDSGDKYEIISKPGTSKAVKLHDILVHQNKVRSLKVLQTALRKANTPLKANKYGKRYFYSETMATFIWTDYLKVELQRFDIKIEGNSRKPMWGMGRGVAKCVFDDVNIFSKKINHPWHDTKVVGSNLRFSFNLQSGKLIVRGIQLKYVDGNVEGLAGMTRLKIDSHEDFHFELFDIPSYAQHEILQCLSSDELLIVKNVSKEIYDLCCQNALR
eukprot:415545_1